MFETRPNVLLELQVAAWCQALGSGLNTCFSGGVLVEAASASSSMDTWTVSLQQHPPFVRQLCLLLIHTSHLSAINNTADAE